MIREFAIELARLSSELKCEQVVLIDVRGRNQLCEYLVIVSGTSDRQMKSVSDQLKAFGAQHGSPRWKRDRDTNGTWIAADFVDVVVHLFEPGQRAWYDLEGMWADAPRVEWRRNVPAKSAGESMPSKKHGEGKSALHMIAVEDVSSATIATAKSSTKKTPAKKSSTKKTTAKTISTKKTTAKKASTKKATVKKPSAKKPAAKKVASTKASSKSASAKSKKTAAQKSSSR